MATGQYDDNGFWIYGEDDLADEGQGFSEVLNKGARSVATAVPSLVTRNLSEDPAIREAAAARAAELAQSDKDLFRSSAPGAPTVRDIAGLLIALTSKEGERTWLEAARTDGGPTDWALELFRQRTGLGGRVSVPGYLLALTDSEGRFTDLAIRAEDGQFAEFVVDRLAARLATRTGATAAVAPRGLPHVPILAARLASAQTDAAPCALVFTGSSTTANSGVTADQGYVNQLVRAFQRRYPAAGGSESTVQTNSDAQFTLATAPGVHGYNVGLGGTTADTYLDNGKSDRIAALTPAAIFHMVGSNDFGRGVVPDTYRDTILARLAYFDTKLTVPCQHVLVHPYQRMDIASPAYPWKAYGDALRQVAAARRDVAVIDISDAYARTGVPGGDPLDLLRTDDVHQNVRGYRLMADLLTDTLL